MGGAVRYPAEIAWSGRSPLLAELELEASRHDKEPLVDCLVGCLCQRHLARRRNAMHRAQAAEALRRSRASLRKSWGAAAVGQETALLALGGVAFRVRASGMMVGPRSTPISL